MKDQYFGDKTDYIKHSILRIFASKNLKLGLHWMWTPDDQTNDGNKISYLNNPGLWKHYDPELFDLLSKHVFLNDRRLKVLVENNMIPNSTHWFSESIDTTSHRKRDIDAFLNILNSESLVFMDPDNGLSVKSVKPESKKSCKYLFDDEVKKVWEAGHSLMIYQHFPRVQRNIYIAQQHKRLVSVVKNAKLGALVTGSVVFLLLFQKIHQSNFDDAIHQIAYHWNPHVTVQYSNTLNDWIPIAIKPKSQIQMDLFYAD